MKVVTGTANPNLAKTIAENLQAEFVVAECSTFKNGEQKVLIDAKFAGETVVLVQSHTDPADANIMQLLFMIDAAERQGAKQIFLVIPWLGYSLQDKVFRSGEAIAAKVVADILSRPSVDRIFLVDLHSNSIPGFFSRPTTPLSVLDLFRDYAKEHFELANCVVVSPDFGGIKRARQFAEALNTPFTNIDKQRDVITGAVTTNAIHGVVKDKVCLTYDDAIVSGGTIIETTQLLKKEGAKEVHIFASHGIFAKDAETIIKKSGADSIVVTNSVAQKKHDAKIKIIDIAPKISEAVSQFV
ncbi:MAG: ribose-phosphate pyrophosphokinase [bacterium]|nr:ribose-phosphate pyrophosphokinase [bacterium]